MTTTNERTDAATAPRGDKLITQTAIEQFLYREARYLDDREFEKWLTCYADDCEYWMPAWADDDELTRTRKVRRGFIADKYGVLIDALYSGKSEQFIETAVKFEDGRTGKVAATLTILDAKTFPPVRSAA